MNNTYTSSYENFINEKVCKKSGKPFKSTFKTNTVKDLVICPYTRLPAFTFLEDSSIVDCRRCLLVDKSKL
jgi:hypothetical protein